MQHGLVFESRTVMFLNILANFPKFDQLDLSFHFSHNDDFDVIRYIPESDGFDHVDEFEEVQLKPCDYVDSIEPQQKRKTILDDFAAWLQKPALSATDSRQESRKNEAVANLTLYFLATR